MSEDALSPVQYREEIERNELVVSALKTLDPDNEMHWTEDGLPKVKLVQSLTEQTKLKRADIEAAWPEFTRDTLLPPPAEEVEQRTLAEANAEYFAQERARVARKRERDERLAAFLADLDAEDAPEGEPEAA